jgi:1-deoxy-D-xylulose-5-phosphate synthase
LGDPAERFLAQVKEGVKAGLHGGMLFEDLGFRYLGPIDGHNIGLLRKYLRMVRDADGPVLLHIVTEKGHGFKPAAQDPVFFHTPAPFVREKEEVVEIHANQLRTLTHVAADSIATAMASDPRVTVLTAAMCQGNKLEAIRDRFPERFFDTGICESHAVAFAAGQAKAGLRPIVDIYSTFLQRGFDQIFQEVALQNLPVAFTLDRAGLTGPDGPTHHGQFDIGYLRLLPNMVVMAPGDAHDLTAMIEFAVTHDAPCAVRYPIAPATPLDGPRPPIDLGHAEVRQWGTDGCIICCGTLLAACQEAVAALTAEGLDVGLINARFVKPLDEETILKALRECDFVVTVEEASLVGGFGSAVLEAANAAGVASHHLRRCGLPDRFVEHGDRDELLADLQLDADAVAAICRQLAASPPIVS